MPKPATATASPMKSQGFKPAPTSGKFISSDMKRLGLRLKFALFIVLLFATIFGVIGLILVRQNSNSLRDDLNTKSKLFSSLATTPIGNAFLTYQDSGQIKITQQIDAFTDLSREISNVAIIDTAGRVAFNQDPKQSISIDSQTARTFTTIYRKDQKGIIDRIVVPLIEDNGSHRYNLVYFISSASVVSSIHHTEKSILLSVIVGLFLSIGLTYVLTSKLFVEPIRRVSIQALAISAGRLDQQVQQITHDEVGDLSMAVNAMADSLKADIAKLQEVDRLKTEFMMISSHNLRTPLTIINGYLDEIKKYKVESKLTHLLDTIAVSSKRLTAFAEDMLTISQVEAGKDVMQKRPTELNGFLQNIATDFVILARQKGLTFTADISTGTSQAEISTAHMNSAIWNLLDNAFKFTDAGGWIKLQARLVGLQAEIAISDSGIGIAKEEMPKLFTKFHRGTRTDRYDYEGTGIGLYATKLVIEQLGGTIVANSELGHGATFTILLPIVSSLDEDVVRQTE